MAKQRKMILAAIATAVMLALGTAAPADARPASGGSTTLKADGGWCC